MFVIRNNDYKEMRAESFDDCKKAIEFIKSEQYDFIAFNYLERDFLLFQNVSAEKCRLMNDYESQSVPYSEVPMLLNFPTYNRMDFLENNPNENVFFSCLGWPATGRREAWINLDSPEQYKAKLAKLYSFYNKKRLLFYGRTNTTEIRLRQIEKANEQGYTPVVVKVDIYKQSLIDYMIENECFAVLGVDGESIGCHRDWETTVSAVPVLRITEREKAKFAIDPADVFFCIFENNWDFNAAVLELFNSYASNKLENRLIAGKDFSVCAFENDPYFRVMEAVVKGDHLFTKTMIRKVATDEIGYKECTKAFVEHKHKAPMISFVVTCMGRLEHIKKSLPTLINQPDSEYILVDYSCPEETGKWASINFPKTRVINVPNKTVFIKTEAQNKGSNLALGKWICFTDSDIEFPKDFVDQIHPILSEDSFYITERKGGIWGTIICTRDDFIKAGGYDENFQGWGAEDDDLIYRLSKISKKQIIEPKINHIDHGNDMRVKFYNIKNNAISADINRAYARAKYKLKDGKKSLSRLYKSISINVLNDPKFKIISYKDNCNLGDIFQTVATARLLGKTDGIYRGDMKYADESKHFIVNGCMIHEDPPVVDALYSGIYLSAKIDQYIEAIKRSTYEVGARDPFTQKLLQDKGIDAKMIGCATLTFDRYEGPRNGVYAVDYAKDNCINLTHNFPEMKMPFLESWGLAIERLDLYKTAEAVYTSRLHVALPCLAFGTPVCVKNPKNAWHAKRFTILSHLGLEYDKLTTLDVSKTKNDYINFLANNLQTEIKAGDPEIPLI